MIDEELDLSLAAVNIVLDSMYTLFRLLDTYETPPYLRRDTSIEDEEFETCVSVLAPMDHFVRSSLEICADYTDELAKEAIKKYLVLCFSNGYFFKSSRSHIMDEQTALKFFEKTKPTKRDIMAIIPRIEEEVSIIHDNEELAECAVSDFLEYWIKI